MDHQKHSRLQWVKMHLETKDAGLVCRRCGVSRPTLRKWVKRYNSLGDEVRIINELRQSKLFNFATYYYLSSPGKII